MKLFKGILLAVIICLVTTTVWGDDLLSKDPDTTRIVAKLFQKNNDLNEIVNIPMGSGQKFTRAEWEASNFATEQELQWFRDAKYGMLICFGLSTRVNMDLSWGVVKIKKAPDDFIGEGRYEDEVWQSWAKEMKMENFDAKEWVDIAKKGGFKYIVLVVKHHDGFHLWDTAHSDFKITNTPFGRDLVKEVVDACHEAKMPIGLYYSQRDWYHPDYCPVDPEKVTRGGIHWTLKPGYKTQQGESHAKYIDYQNKVVEELCTKYGKIDIFWWDAKSTNGMFTEDMWDGEAINRKIRKWQPGIIINNRCSVPGDYDTPEQRLGSYQDFRPWESCMSLTTTWSYSGATPKTLEQLVFMIVNNACGDGNLLLSWGPKWDGEFASNEKARLLEVGDWLQKNGRAIYGTRGGPWQFGKWAGGSVRRGNTVFLHVLNWPGETLRLPAIPNRKVVGAKLLDGTAVTFTQANDIVSVTVPKDRQAAIDTIVELTMDQSVDGLPALAASTPSIFTDTVTYGKVISTNATVKASSSCKYDPAGSPQLLVSEKMADDFAFCTAAEKNPWVEIDLGKEATVTGIRIINRSRSCQDRAKTLQLSVSTDGKTWEKIWQAKTLQPVWEVPITDYQIGAEIAGRKLRYLRLETKNESPTHFHLKQIDIYGREFCDAVEFTVAPDGNDDNPGTLGKPFATVQRAAEAIRNHPERGKVPITVTIRPGIYYLEKTLVFGPKDSGKESAPVTYTAENAGQTVISGGMKLDLKWTPFKGGVFQAETPVGMEIDQLFVNGKRRHMARYPNYDENARPYNGAAADAFSPERAARWADPTGGYIHAMHSHRWGGYHYRITGKNDKNEVSYEGGWQNNRQMGMHPNHRFVENIFEELDAPGEWFHDAEKNILYYMPDKDVDINVARFEIVRLQHLIELRGSKETPVGHLVFKGLVFRHAARTFMDTKEPLLRSDWTIYRGGAVLIEGAEDCIIADCEFDQVGGNAVFVSKYNRRIAVRGSYFHGIGASAVCFVGSPDAVRSPLFEYSQRQAYGDIDKAPGPKTDEYPADCIVEDCLIHSISQVEKQATGVQISMSKHITVRHCSIYDTGRAGINISEGTFGGHVIEFCDVFDTVKETSDHGSFNSWGRDRYWHLKDAPEDELPELARLDTEKTIIRNSRWRCDHGWDVDLDDGSSYYEIYNNVFLRGGLKLREGFHRKAYNNIGVNSTLHAHVWYPNSGDVVTGNIWMAAYAAPALMPSGAWGKCVDRNLFVREDQRLMYAAKNWDLNSISGDPMFVDPAKGDYRVKEGSPAFKIGFKNFPMDKFGVQKPELKAKAKKPVFPELNFNVSMNTTYGGKMVGAYRVPSRIESYWQGATVQGLIGEEFSAFGVSKEDGGVHLLDVPEGSLAGREGLKKGDLIQRINSSQTKTVEQLLKATDAAAGRPLEIEYVRSQVSKKGTMAKYVYVVTETTDGDFSNVKLLPPDGIIRIKSISTTPGAANEPVSVLTDNKLAENYGAVFTNGAMDAVYSASFSPTAIVTEVRTWSYNQGGNRGAQKFTLFGTLNKNKPVPIAVIDTGKSGKFTATKIKMSDESSLGTFSRLEWHVRPVTDPYAHTAYQEFQVK